MYPDNKNAVNELVEYQTPLEQGRNLRYHELADGLRISRDVVSRFVPWREAIFPVLVIGMLIFAAAMFVRNLHQWQLDPTLEQRVRIVGLVMLACVTVWIIRVSWLNAGVVTEIAITRGALYWRKLNLWGHREFIWPLQTITTVHYDSTNHSLRIRRIRGAALNAFAYFPMEELSEAAARVSEAIERNRPPVSR